jgi:hypothetical protein
MLKKAVQRGRSERRGEAYRGPVAHRDATGESYVELFALDPLHHESMAMGAPTKLADFFNILLRS